MADTGIFATSAAILIKAGKGVNTVSGANITNIDIVSSEVESFINATTRNNWSDVYTTLNVDVRNILREVASDLAAIYFVSYDMSGYTSRIEAEDIINVLRDRALAGLSILRDKKVQDFIIGS